jgi:hypothetical protein
MRRSVTLLVACLLTAALVVGAVGLASAGHDGPAQGQQRTSAPAKAKPIADRHARGDRDAHGAHGVIATMILSSLAGRLEVEPAKLRRAATDVARDQWQQRLATLSPAQRSALVACKGRAARKGARRPGGCDRRAARAALRTLKASVLADLPALKQQLAAAVAAKLGVTPEKLLEAVRAELEQRLGQAVAMGLVSEKGRGLALQCFDDPASCDVDALRSEVRHGRLGHHRHR